MNYLNQEDSQFDIFNFTISLFEQSQLQSNENKYQSQQTKQKVIKQKRGNTNNNNKTNESNPVKNRKQTGNEKQNRTKKEKSGKEKIVFQKIDNLGPNFYVNLNINKINVRSSENNYNLVTKNSLNRDSFNQKGNKESFNQKGNQNHKKVGRQNLQN